MVVSIFLCVIALWILFIYVNKISFNINLNSEKVSEGKSLISETWFEISKMFGFMKEKGSDLLNEIQKEQDATTTTQ